MKVQKSELDEQLKIAKSEIHNYKTKHNALRRETNTLKRHNSKLIMNSFISELTEIPRNNAKSQVRTTIMHKDYSTYSFKNLLK